MAVGIESAALSVLTRLAEPALRALALAIVAGGGLMLLGVRRTGVTLCVWTIVLIAALAMPVLDLVMPALPLRIIPTTMTEMRTPQPLPVLGKPPRRSIESSLSLTTTAGTPAATPQPASSGHEAARQAPRQSTPWSLIALLVYACGVIVLLVRSAAGHVARRRFDRTVRAIDDVATVAQANTVATRSGLTRCPQLVESNACLVPITTGMLNPAIVLPATWREWPATTLEAVLIHELSHVARRDALTQALARLHRAIFWFSPLSWWLQSKLAQLAEYASDEAVLAGGVDRADYAQMLLQFFAALGRDHRRVTWQIAMAQGAGAERRINRILGWNGASKTTTTALVVITAALAVPCVALVAAAKPVERVAETNAPRSVTLSLPPAGSTAPMKAFDPPTRPTPTAQSDAKRTQAVTDPLRFSMQIESPDINSLPENPPRVVVVLVDDANIQFIETARLRDLVRRIIKDQIRPGDFGVIVSWSSSGESVELSYDQAMLLAAVSKLGGEGDGQHITPGFDRAAALLKQLGTITSKEKRLLWITDGPDQSFSARADELAAAAKNSGTSFFTLDPRGLTPRPGSPQSNEWQDYARNTADSLNTVAALTGRWPATWTPRPDFNGKWLLKEGSPRLLNSASGKPAVDITPALLITQTDSSIQVIDGLSLIKTPDSIQGNMTSYWPDEHTNMEHAFRWVDETLILSPDGKNPYSQFTFSLDASGALVVAATSRTAQAQPVTATYERSHPTSASKGRDVPHETSERTVVAPKAIKEIKPAYTRGALAQKIHGLVQLECIVERDGSVSDPRVITSLDSQYGLDQQAIAALLQWKFQPGTLDGQPVRVIVHLDMTFTLR